MVKTYQLMPLSEPTRICSTLRTSIKHKPCTSNQALRPLYVQRIIPKRQSSRFPNPSSQPKSEKYQDTGSTMTRNRRLRPASAGILTGRQSWSESWLTVSISHSRKCTNGTGTVDRKKLATRSPCIILFEIAVRSHRALN